MSDREAILEQMRRTNALHKKRKIQEEQAESDIDRFSEALIAILHPYEQTLQLTSIRDVWPTRLTFYFYLRTSGKLRFPRLDDLNIVIDRFNGRNFEFQNKADAVPYLREVLYSALLCGTLRATGIDARKIMNGNRVEIPSDRWEFLEVDSKTSSGVVGSNLLVCGLKISRHVHNNRSKAGRKPKADWEFYEGLFLKEVDLRGFPWPGNSEGWRSKADVGRFLLPLAQRDGKDVSESTIKRHVDILFGKHASSREP